MNNKLKKPSPDYLYEILAWQDFADDELEQALGSEQNDWMPPQAAAMRNFISDEIERLQEIIK